MTAKIREQMGLIEWMTFRTGGNSVVPLAVFEVNGSFVVGVYKGTLSEFDILVKYRQKVRDEWSRIRTPKHIHWAVDILIKLHEDRPNTQKFLDFLIGMWETIQPVRTEIEQQQLLSVEQLFRGSQETIGQYNALSSKGEYSIKFLVLLAKLLMIQEKTNHEAAYMFKKLLTALRDNENIFSVISIASHNRR